MPDKSETYSVEGDNAELRHYLPRLVRRSRCFSRCEKALRKAVRILSSHSTSDNCTSRNTQIILLILLTLHTHLFSHSRLVPS